MNSPKNIDVICFGGEDWWYHNRGHIDMQLMRRFAKSGTTLYVNSIVMQKPKLSEGRKFIKKLVRKIKSILTGLRKSDAGFWVYSSFTLPVQHLDWLRPINEVILRFQLRLVAKKLKMHNPIIWVACPVACDVALRMKNTKLVYQRTDCYEAYPNVDVKTVTRYDRKLKAEADMTIFVSLSLYDKEAVQCKNAVYLDHGVDYELFASEETNLVIPLDMANIKKPIVGYFGALDEHKFDVGLVEILADLLPDMSFVFVGKASVDCSALLSKKNVWMLGQKSYEQIPYYGKCFYIAIFPWKVNKWTEAANPIKLKEYLALGKPVVSTPAFAEMQQYVDVIYEATTPEEFADCIKKALAEDNPERVAARRSKVKDASWESKAEQVMNELFGNLCDN